MTTETNHREFEEWAKQAGYWLHINPYDDIEKYYDSSDTESAWEVWQAARGRQDKELREWKSNYQQLASHHNRHCNCNEIY